MKQIALPSVLTDLDLVVTILLTDNRLHMLELSSHFL